MQRYMTTTAEQSATDVYALGRDPGESARLQRQSEELRPDSATLLDRVALGPGQHAIDLGCGPRGILDLLAEMVRLAKPGGWVASLEPDVEGALCHPAHPAYTRMWELFRAAFGRNGADLLIGRRLAELYRQGGLHDIGIEARARVCQPADSRRTIGPDLVRSLHPVIVSLGLADQGELDALDRAVRAHLDDPRTLVMPHLSFLAWGRKPAARSHE